MLLIEKVGIGMKRGVDYIGVEVSTRFDGESKSHPTAINQRVLRERKPLGGQQFFCSD